MQNNDPFYLNKNSKLYKFYKTLNQNSFTSWLVPRDEYTEELKCFTNLCLFLRTTFFIFLFFSFFIITAFVGITSFNVSFVDAINSNNFFLVFLAFFKVICPVMLSLVLCLLIIQKCIFKIENKYYSNTKVNKEYKIKKPNIFLQSIKDKHNKICRSFIIKDE